MSNSAGKLHKYVSKTKQSEPEKKKIPQISPLLPKKTEFGVLPDEKVLEDLIQKEQHFPTHVLSTFGY